jgi:hypothetical protein
LIFNDQLLFQLVQCMLRVSGVFWVCQKSLTSPSSLQDVRSVDSVAKGLTARMHVLLRLQVNCDTGQQAVAPPDHFRQVAAALELSQEQQQQLRSAFKVS